LALGGSLRSAIQRVNHIPAGPVVGPVRYFYYGRSGGIEYALADFSSKDGDGLTGAPFLFKRFSGGWRLIADTGTDLCPMPVPKAMLVAWRLLPASCGGPPGVTFLISRPDELLERPDGFPIEVHDGLIQLAWWRWGGARAEALGGFLDAAKHRTYRVTVRADGRKRCTKDKTSFAYTRVTFTFVGAPPAGSRKTYSYPALGSEEC